MIDFKRFRELKEIVFQSFCQTLDLAKYFKIEKQNLLNEQPFYINVISSAARGKLKETAHSKILHDLLHNEEILSSFLETIVGLDPKTFCKKDISYPDQDRIDLSFISKENRKFLIIENKINSAPEQEAQLYRYVHEIAEKQYKFKDEEIYILYLNPDTNKPPSLFSRSKEGKGKESDKETIKVEKIILKNYKYDILNWLKTVQKWKFKKKEHFLKSAIIQYKDYLEEYFEVNEKQILINKKMKDKIFEVLNIDKEKPIEEQIKILQEYSADLSLMQSELSRIQNELILEKEKNDFQKGFEQLKEEFKDKIQFQVIGENPDSVKFAFECIGEEFTASLKSDGGYPYWAISSEKDPSLINKESMEILKRILKNMDADKLNEFDLPYSEGKSKEWLFYLRTTNSTRIQRLRKLSELLINANDEIKII